MVTNIPTIIRKHNGVNLVRTYAPFERGWLPCVNPPSFPLSPVRTYAPFERGWLLYRCFRIKPNIKQSGLTPRLRGDGYIELNFLATGSKTKSGLTPRLRGDGYFETVVPLRTTHIASGLTPRLRGDGYQALPNSSEPFWSVRTYAPFERGWLPTGIVGNVV